MATTAATLDILVNARTQSATSSLRRMDTSTRTSATHLKNLDKTSGRLTTTLSRVGRAAVGAAAGYVGLSAAKTAVTNTADLAKTTMSLNKNMGFTVKTASELGANLKIRGSDAKAAQMAFATFSGVLHQAAQGSASARDRLAELGISGKKLQRDLKNPEQALFDVSDGLKNLGAGMQRTDDTRKLFGRGWSALSPILRGGADDLKKNLDMADQMGASFSNLGIKNMQDFIDAQHQAQLGMLGMQISFTQTLAPALIGAMNQFSDLAKNIREKGFVPAISDAISKAAEKAGEMAPKVLAAFAKGFADTSLQGKLALSAILIGKLGGSKAWLFLGKKFGLAILEGLATTQIGAKFLALFPSVGKMQEEGRLRGGAMGAGLVAGLVLGTVGLAALLGDKIASIVPNISIFSKGYIQKQFGYAFQAIQQAIPTMSNLGGKVAAAFRNPLDGGLFKGLAGDLRTKLFGPFQAAAGWITGAFQKVIGFFNGLPGSIKSAMKNVGGFLISPFRDAVSAISGFIHDIVNVINTVLGPIGVHIGGGGGGGTPSASAQQKTPQGGKGQKTPGGGRQKGGGIFVGGSGSGDKVPAMLEPGEFVLNRNAVAAVGLQNVSKLNKDIPRFARGGLSSTNPKGRGATGHPTTATSAAGGFGLPGLGGVPGWLQPAGSFVLDKVGGFIKSKLASAIGGIFGGVGGDLLLQTNTPAQIAKVLNTGVGFGKSHAGGPYTWGGGHSGFSGPYDCSGYVSAILHSMGMLSSPQTTDGLKGWGAAGPGKYMTVGVRGTTGRNAHTMMRIGNLFFESGGGHGAAVEGGWDGSFPIKRHWPGLAEGGTVMDVLKRHKIKLGPKSFDPNSSEFVGWGLQSGGRVPNPKHGAHWIKDLGSHVDANEAATLLWQAGLSEADAGALSRVVPGESGGNVMAHNASGATGLFQILGSVFPGNLYDPRINAINAAIKWRTQGRGAWEAADSGSAGHILRARVGAVARGGTTKTPKTKKTPKGGGGSGSSAFDDALQAFHDINDPRIGSMNELIGEGNLEALQRYQVGASQNPLVGLGKPGFPSPQALLSTDPTLDDIIGIDKQLYAPGAGPFTQLPAKHQDWGGTAGFQNRPVHHHTHVHVDGKEVAHVVHKENKKEARRGRRPLPSSRRQ